MIGTKLTFENIEKSPEIQSWLNQFSANDVLSAKSLLCRLQFISRDEYSRWLLSKLCDYSTINSAAIYSVRKFNNNVSCFWQEDGETQPRPAHTQGSEDLVSSVISNAKRQYNNCFLDHPSLTELKEQKTRNIILVDDSIGSGKRVADFIELMTNSKTFMSWWSGGFITLHVLSYARTSQSVEYIKERTSGSDHGKRKIQLSSKLKFDSDLVYDAFDIHTRWGNSSQEIVALCSLVKKIAKDRRKGFGDVMGNIVFFHSVPNNIPGILVSNRRGWIPLFPNRSLPDWTIRLLENMEPSSDDGFSKLQISDIMVDLLELIKTGLKTRASLTRRLDCDERIVQSLIDQAIRLGFVSSSKRLSKTGKDYLAENKGSRMERVYDYSLYIPQSWCAGQGTVQPSDHDTSEVRVQTDFIAFESMDGDDGESSLERTDAMATSSPVLNVAQDPSWPRESHIHNGPQGAKRVGG